MKSLMKFRIDLADVSIIFCEIRFYLNILIVKL